MDYRSYPDGMILYGELFIAVAFEGDERNGHEHEWNEECIKKMRQPVVCNDYFYPSTADARRNLIEMAWYFDPAEMEQSDYWSEEAIRKMREPTAHGHAIFLNLTNLVRLMSML
jgi:hypothetical protein